MTSNSSNSIKRNDIFQHSFFKTFLNQTGETMNKNKRNKTGKYSKKRKVKIDLDNENLDKEVDGLLSSALGKRLEVIDDQDDEDEYADVVLKNKGIKRIHRTKQKKKSLKRSPLRNNSLSPKQQSHEDHRNPKKVQSMKKNSKYVTKFLGAVKNRAIAEANLVTLVNLFSDDELTESSQPSEIISMSNSSSFTRSNDICQGSSFVIKSREKAETVTTMNDSTNIIGELNSEQDIVQDKVHGVHDRLLFSTLGKIKSKMKIDDNQYSDQCVNTENMEVTISPSHKFNEDRLVDISKKISKSPFLVSLNNSSPKDRRHLISRSDTKVQKAKTKTKKKKKTTSKKCKINFSSGYENVIDSEQMEIDRFLLSALHEEGDDRNLDDDNSHNIYEHNIHDSQQITNLFVSKLSPLVESISYPKFIYGIIEDTNLDKSIIKIRDKEDMLCPQKCDEDTDKRDVQSVWTTEQVFIDRDGDSCDIQYRRVITHSKANQIQYFINEETFSNSDVLNQLDYKNHWDIIAEEDEGIELQTELNYDKKAILEQDVLNQSDNENHAEIISEEHQGVLETDIELKLNYDQMSIFQLAILNKLNYKYHRDVVPEVDKGFLETEKKSELNHDERAIFESAALNKSDYKYHRDVISEILDILDTKTESELNYDKKIILEQDVLNQTCYENHVEVILGEHQGVHETDTESKLNYDQSSIFESAILNKPNYKYHRDVISEVDQGNFGTEKKSELNYDERAIFESVALNNSDYKCHQNVISEILDMVDIKTESHLNYAKKTILEQDVLNQSDYENHVEIISEEHQGGLETDIESKFNYDQRSKFESAILDKPNYKYHRDVISEVDQGNLETEKESESAVLNKSEYKCHQDVISEILDILDTKTKSELNYDDKAIFESELLDQQDWNDRDVASEEDKNILETEPEPELHYDKGAIFESGVLHKPFYKNHRDVTSEEKINAVTDTDSEPYYDIMDDLDKETYSYKTKIGNLVEKAVVTDQVFDLTKLTTDQSLYVKRCDCQNRTLFPISSKIFTLTIVIMIIVIFLKNTVLASLV